MSARAQDLRQLHAQLGRTPRGKVTVVVRCGRGAPQVIQTAPRLDDGTPFPTLFWLTCPALKRWVDRLEGAGFIGEIRGRVHASQALARELEEAVMAYTHARDGVADPGTATGIGGTFDWHAVKCLHAHYAHYLATGEDPVGRIVARRLPALNPQTEPICENCRL